jgi:predicted dehydrogenase
MPRQLRAGIIGCGNIAFGHARTLRQLEDVAIAAIADPTLLRRQKLQAELGLSDGACFADARDLLAQELDYVVVATPQHVRRPIVEACAAAGVHVLSEKPIATTPADGEAMVDAMRTAGLRYGIMHNYLFYPEYELALRLIAEGAVGRVRHISLNFLGVPDHPGAAEYQPGWRHDPAAAGGGILMDMIHAVYLAEHLMGAPMTAVNAVVDNLDHPGDQVEDFAIANYHFAHGYATVNMWWGSGPGGVEISGTEGRIMVFYENYGTGPFTKLASFTLVNGAGLQQFEARGSGSLDPFLAIHRDFASAVRIGRDPVAPAEAGLRALQATLATYTAGVGGATISLPLPPTHPVYRCGAGGLADKSLWSQPPLRRGLFGVE